MSTKPIPDGYHTVTPYLIVENAAELLPFLEKALGATVTRRTQVKDGSVNHAEIQLGDSRVMLGGATAGFPVMPAMLYVYVEDCDALYRRAVDAGAESMMEPTDMYYGDRNCGVKDPAGNIWWIGTHLRDISEEELQRLTEENR